MSVCTANIVCTYECKYSFKAKTIVLFLQKKEEKETHFLQEKVIIGYTSSSQKYPSMY